MDPRLRAIVWAQWRSLWNIYPRASKAGMAFTAVSGLVWYSGVLALTVIFGRLAASAAPNSLARFLPIGLLVGLLFWQLIPLLLASTGATLDVRRLMVYPVPHRHLFAIEVILRLTTGIDVVLMITGVAVGMLFNRGVPLWGPLWFLPFIVFNLTLSAGVRDLLARLFARKRFREIAVLVLIFITTLPQLLVMTGVPPAVLKFLHSISSDFWPWALVSRLALGGFRLVDVAVLAAWTAGSFLFGRWQFEAGLKFDHQAAEATPTAVPSRRSAALDRLFRLPSAVFADPLGGLIEKEIRFLCRSPRFRLVFLMGFSFGLLIWMPIAFAREGGATFIGKNFLTFVSVYSLMLLGEVSFYNNFGFDRSATQVYFLIPVRFFTVMLAKNITAALFVFVEILAVTAACLALRLPLPLHQVPEAFSVTVVLTIYLMSVGNLSSTHYPAAVDPGQSWRSRGAGRFHIMLLLIYPLVSLPISLSYLARWAFDSQWAFYLSLAVVAAVGCVVYWMSMDSAIRAAATQREKILGALSRHESPIAAA